MILVDSSVILDIWTDDPKWYGWSASQVMRLHLEEPLAINPIIYGEVTIKLSNPKEADAHLFDYKRQPLPFDAAYWAGKAFLRYRQSGGNKLRPLPDFFIGAHAYVMGWRVLTRDPNRIKTYFPSVGLIAP